ncbi:hypothetical protein VNI00_000699 [Paramarasmius palmivorus]|uniref:Integrase catalytic domain-containing protein n=1 Tax=Paramarasmius palmivorus TaxID=297713 RepID=A0AAW0EA68_9AGAR
MTDQQPSSSNETNETLLEDAFRAHYHVFRSLLLESSQRPEPYLLQILGEDLQEFAQITENHSHVFSSGDEWDTLRTNLQIMLGDVRVLHERAVESTHSGYPTVVYRVYSGGRGRPRTIIDPDFLRWAYRHRTTSGISRFLGISRTRVRELLLEHEIAPPGQNPFPSETSEEDDDILDPSIPVPEHLPNDVQAHPPSASSGYLSDISDNELDDLIHRLRSHYSRAGIRILDGMLRRLGHIVPYERIRLSLSRIDPVHRVFDRIRIRRRRYSVPGPNFLWHHDGHHGLIRWGIIIHGFIDGYSRYITGMQASNNNTAMTVLLLFLAAILVHGIPSRLRGDHGVENILVAAFMEHLRGIGRGSYIWGRSVHNVRIERLWVDVRVAITATWDENFTELELNFGLDITNSYHIWLLQLLFLPIINSHIEFWVHSWNMHRITMQDGPNRSPDDIFGFDMLVRGLRRDSMNDLDLSNDELEVFGVDWEGLQEDVLLRALRQNYAREGSTSWIGRGGPPPHLNEVRVDPPQISVSLDDLEGILDQRLGALQRGPEKDTVIVLWVHALAIARQFVPGQF